MSSPDWALLKYQLEEAREVAAHLADCILNGRKVDKELLDIALRWLRGEEDEEVGQ